MARDQLHAADHGRLSSRTLPESKGKKITRLSTPLLPLLQNETNMVADFAGMTASMLTAEKLVEHANLRCRSTDDGSWRTSL
ncbi:uncharacterized protein UV8b_05425 [Ustilaginoidea virens]|uniref:Uncharacterized protein n=1 Tax=Ustilaginoidea virens TaxID=1159556 RepID=A0A8E5MIM4_USTVR|nr:uncharacterized protein UV8b_05425 [Ustilaginoidea virens]QUC21182.1 hypothetical protein UV8b_05425 [Ustilaginoidea virens]